MQKVRVKTRATSEPLTMQPVRTCPKCGADLPKDALGGLCPKCLVQAAFRPETGGQDEEIGSQKSEVGGQRSAGSGQQAAPAEGQTIRLDLDGDSVIEPTGLQIGHYKLLQKIGEGGFGVVYMAEQDRTAPAQGRPQGHQARHGYAGR